MVDPGQQELLDKRPFVLLLAFLPTQCNNPHQINRLRRRSSMAKKKRTSKNGGAKPSPSPAEPAPPPPPPSIHEGELSSELSGAVDYGPEISEAQAVTRRQAGLDIVVRGTDRAANRRLAGKIESAVGDAIPHFPHRAAGAYALPHWQQKSRSPAGHSFYETDNFKARKKP
jgi:hypothetical protein